MDFIQILHCICDMRDVTLSEAQEIYRREQEKGKESFERFLESIGDWYYNL